MTLEVYSNQPNIPIISEFKSVESKNIDLNKLKFYLAQETFKENQKNQPFQAPDGYILCPKEYVCIPKTLYNGSNSTPNNNSNNSFSPNTIVPNNNNYNQTKNQTQEFPQNLNQSNSPINNSVQGFPPSVNQNTFNPQNIPQSGGFGYQGTTVNCNGGFKF